jgi:hypothetical protein
MSEQEPFTHDFIDVRYVKDLWHVLQRVGYLGKALDEVGMPPDDSPYLGVLRETRNLIAEIEDLVKSGAFRDLKEFPD